MASEPWVMTQGDQGPYLDRPRPLGELFGDRESSESPPSGRSGGVAKALLRRWPTFVVTVMGVWLCTAAFLVLHSPTYTSTTTVFLKPVAGNALSANSMSNSQQLTVAMETEARLVQSPDVAALAAEVAGRRLATETAALTATVLPNTQIVRIQFTAVTPALAHRGAEAFANAFLAFRTAQGKDSENRQLASLRTQSAAAQRQLQSAIRSAGAARPAPGASTRVQLYTSRLAAISESIGQIQSQDVNPGAVVTPASAPRTTLLSGRKVVLGGAIAAGLALALLAVLIRERADDRVAAERDTEIADVPVWARIPRRSGTGSHVDELDDADPVRESFRQVRTAMIRATARPCVVAITRDPALSSVVGTTLDLGLTLAGAGHGVAVIDASLEPDATAGIATAHGLGLSDQLSSRTPSPLRTQPWRGLRLLTAGPGLPPSRDLLAAARMADLVEGLRGVVDFVLLAVPEATSAEAVTLGELGDATVLVVQDRGTRRRQIAEHAARHADYGSGLIGIIALTRPKRSWRGVGTTQDLPLRIHPRVPVRRFGRVLRRLRLPGVRLRWRS